MTTLIANLILKACGMEPLNENEVQFLSTVKPKAGNMCEDCQTLAEKETACLEDQFYPDDGKWHKITPIKN
jgi:hypothetical protein